MSPKKCRDQIPTQGTKKSGKYYLPVKEEREKREQDGEKLKKGTRRGKTEKRNKAEENCRKYATEMKNAPPSDERKAAN